MNTSEYYILPKNRISLVEHSDVVGNAETVRWSNDEEFFIIKTKEGIKNSGALTPFIPLSHSEVLLTTRTDPNWVSEL